MGEKPSSAESDADGGPVFEGQPGPQFDFLATSADIAIYGGAAGSGKSYALLLDQLRHADNPGFGGVVFRRTSPQLVGAGSLWEDAKSIYVQLGHQPINSQPLRIDLRAGGMLQFLHLQYAHTVLDHQGKQYACIYFDELTHFEESQFWYMVSRNRSTSGIDSYVRATTNPDPDSFVRDLIAWWIGKDGYAIKERSGVLRWFVRIADTMHWGDTRDALAERWAAGEFGVVSADDFAPKSITFIAAELSDNPALTSKDPGYRGRLLSLPEVEQERLLRGNWDVRHEGGEYIREEYFARRWSVKPRLNIYMASDFAVTERTGDNDPDFTEHGVFGVDSTDNLHVIDWWYGQRSADVWIESLLDLVVRHKPLCWFGESGVIRNALESSITKRAMERRVYFRQEWVSPIVSATTTEHMSYRQGYRDRSKRAKAIRGRAFQARAAMGKIVMPEH